MRESDADRVERGQEPAEEGGGREDDRLPVRQEDEQHGGAGKAEAEHGQDTPPIDAVGHPADRNLEHEPAEHGSEHEQRDGRLVDPLVLHPRRNERVEGAGHHPAQGGAEHCDRRRAQELTEGQRLTGDRLRWLRPGRAHHDEADGEQRDDSVEGRRRRDVGLADEELSGRQGDERADHVDGEDPPARVRRGLGIQPALGRDEDPAQPNPTTARRTSQGSGPGRSGMAAVAAPTSPPNAA